MALPRAEQAVVEPRKIRDYLLSPSHPLGRFKATFFEALGYSAEDWEVLVADLRRHAAEGEVVAREATRYGQRCRVGGPLRGPSGKEADVVSVWIILDGEYDPRFVTAFPGARP